MSRADDVTSLSTADVIDVPLILCMINLGAAVFLQRIVIPLGGIGSLSCLVPIAWATVLILLWRNAASINVLRSVSCFLFLSGAIASQLLNISDFSVTSLALLIAIYSLGCVQISLSAAEFLRVLRFFQGCVAVVATLAIIQFAMQFVNMRMMILEDFVPDGLIVKDFVYLQEVLWKSGVYKPNGMFMLEPSFLSQFTALSLIIEYWFFKRTPVLCLLGIALLLAFSGTGLVLAAISIMTLTAKRGFNRQTFIVLTIGALVAAGLFATGWLSALTARVAEFSDPQASASVRFLAPIARVFETFTQEDLRALLLGSGAGYIDRTPGFAWNPPVKIWVEYGALVFVLYLLYLRALWMPVKSSALALPLALEYLLLGGGALLQAPVVFTCLFLCYGLRLASEAEWNASCQSLPSKRNSVTSPAIKLEASSLPS